MSCSEYDAERLRQELAANDDVSELGISVEIAADRVFLRGRVSTAARRRAVAEIAARSLPGCVLVNEVEVTELSAPGMEHLE